MEQLKALCEKEPTNFNYWVKYLAEAEKSSDYVEGRLAFETFLDIFPLCYGYWGKFAAYVGKAIDDEDPSDEGWKRVRDIYEKGVAAVPTSVDMWIYYLTFLEQSKRGITSAKDGVECLRRLFERAVNACGTDPGAELLWNKYITFEQHSRVDGDASVCELYHRIVTLNWQGATQYWQLYLEILQQCALTSIATFDEIASMRAEIETSSGDGEEGSSAAPSEKRIDDDDDTLVRAKIIEKRTEEYAAAATEAYKRSVFEQQIKRSYYHIKVLDDAQIANWDAYLTFEESENSEQRPEVVERLYERCLVPCANMPKFWIRYVRWMESVGKASDAIEAVFARACSTFVKNLPEVHMERALWYESCGDVAAAERVYANLTSYIAPGLLEAILRFANFKRRQGAVAEGETMLVDAAKATSDAATKAFLCLQRGNYIRATKVDPSRVVDAYEEAVKAVPSDMHVWATLLRYLASTERIAKTEKDASKASVSSVFDKALLESALSATDKAKLWQLRICIEENCGSNVRSFRTLRKAYDKWTRSSALATGTDRKRVMSSSSSSEDASYGNGWDSNAKRARVESNAVAATSAATTTNADVGEYWGPQSYYGQREHTPADEGRYVTSHSQQTYAHEGTGSAYAAGAYAHGGYYSYGGA
eukprot:g2430.t1